MKKFIFTVFWMFVFLVIGFIVFVCLVETVFWLPPHPDLSSPAVQHTAMLIGFFDVCLVVGFPVIALILGICGVLPGTRRRKDLVQT